MNRSLIAVGILLLAGGCVQTVAEGRVRSALVDAGLSPAHAGCMADRMVDRLSIAQLRKLQQLKAQAGERERPLSLSEFVTRVQRVGDAEAVAVTASSAALCAAGIG